MVYYYEISSIRPNGNWKILKYLEILTVMEMIYNVVFHFLVLKRFEDV